jgi:DNA/RNA-binding domain of Phe-tRNA-synthetase-like protein
MAEVLFEIADDWRVIYPGAHAGILAMRGVENPALHPELQRRIVALEAQLRAHFAGQDRKALQALPVMQAYHAYYKPFGKTYHVLAQLESVALKGRTIPSVAALVEAMFMAEVKNGLLSAGHDLDCLQLPVTLDVATGTERYALLRGQEQVLKAGDMFMSDRAGVISSVLYGPDDRTQIRRQTCSVLFAVYAPAGIAPEAVQMHLHDIQEHVRLVSPAATVELLQVYGASSSGEGGISTQT